MRSISRVCDVSSNTMRTTAPTKQPNPNRSHAAAGNN